MKSADSTQQMVLLLDADFLVAPQRFGNALHNGTDRSALTTLRNLLSTDRALVVLPAFNSLVGVDDPGAAWVLRGVSICGTHMHSATRVMFHRRQAGPYQGGGR